LGGFHGVGSLSLESLGNRHRILVAAAGVALLGLASAAVTGWTTFVVLRGLGGLLAGTAAPAVTALSFAAAPERRRGLDLGVVQSSTRLLGSLVSPVVVTAVAVAVDWRVALLTSSAFVVAGALALVLLVPADTVLAEAAADAAPTLHPGGRRNILLCTSSSVALLMGLIVVSQGDGTAPASVARHWPRGDRTLARSVRRRRVAGSRGYRDRPMEFRTVYHRQRAFGFDLSVAW
jgi:MFS family permease